MCVEKKNYFPNNNSLSFLRRAKINRVRIHVKQHENLSFFLKYKFYVFKCLTGQKKDKCDEGFGTSRKLSPKKVPGAFLKMMDKPRIGVFRFITVMKNQN